MKNIILFAFTIVSINIKAQCKVKTEKDKFTGKTTNYVDFADWMNFTKIVSENDTTYYLYLSAEGTTSAYSKEGVIVLFADGSKLEWKTQKVDCKYRAGMMYDYTAFIRLHQEDIESLKTKTMSDFRLYIFDRGFGEKRGLKMKEAFNCLVKS